MNNPKTRQSNLLVQEIEKEVLIYDLTINKAFCLNQTSALVFELADGTRTNSEISELMSVRLKTLVSEDVVWLALDQLRKDNLLEKADELPNDLRGLTRREVIKRVGLSSMVMLPVISSVIAPQAAQAASGATLGLLAVCSTSPECISGNCHPVMGGTTQCCVSTAMESGSGNYGPGSLLPGCYSSQADCNNNAPILCCNGQAGTVFDNGDCGGEFRCPCAATP